MKIILKEDIANLGYKDDVVEVKNGYARNYLIPTGKAIMASPSALKVLAENLRQRAHKIAKIKAKQLNKIGLEKLQGLKGGCLIIENAGLVSPQKLVEVIKDSGADANDYVVVLTGEIDSLARFFEQNQEVVDEFVYLIDIHKIKERGMSIIAKGYVKEKGYKADKSIIDRFKGVLGTMEVGNIDRFLDYIDTVMKKCDDRESSNGDTGKKVITSEDFR